MTYSQPRTPLLLDQIEMRPTSTATTAMMDRIFLSSATQENVVRFSSPLHSADAHAQSHCNDSTPRILSTPRTASTSTLACPSLTPSTYESDSEASSTSERDRSLPNLNVNSNAAMASEDSQVIPKPVGEVGRPGRGGYNLDAILKWSPKRLKQVKSLIRNWVLDTLDCSLCFSDQPLVKLQHVREQAVAEYPFLAKYEALWVVDDMIRCRLKYEKTALKRKADAKLAEQARAKAGKRLSISSPASKKHSHSTIE